jgi:hypothetical protein
MGQRGREPCWDFTSYADRRSGRRLLLTCGFEVGQSLEGQYGDNGVRVAEQADQPADNRDFLGFQTDQWDEVRHRKILSLPYLLD